MHRIGLRYSNPAGTFSDKTNEGSVDLMLAAAEAYSDLVHPVSFMEDGRIYNKYVEGAFYYKLYYDNPDPEIEFTNEVSYEDIDMEQFAKEQKEHEEMMRKPPSLAAINAVRWRLEETRRKSRRR